MTRSDPVQHLQQMLRLNPLHEAEAILQQRARFLGGAAAAIAPDAGRDDDRQRRYEMARRSIEKVRDKFWTAPLDGLIRYLDAVDVRAFPELQVTVARLRQLASVRGEFTEMSQHRKCNPALFNFFKQVVVLPPREAGELKEKTLRYIVAGDAIAACRAMARMLEKNYPHLYQLETDWFRHIQGLKPVTPQQQAVQSTNNSGDVGIPGCLIFFLIIMAIRLITHLFK